MPRSKEKFCLAVPYEIHLETRTGGEGGIRTPGRCYPTLAFQASTINRSDTSPVLGCDYDVFPRSGPVKEIRSKSSEREAQDFFSEINWAALLENAMIV